MNKYFVFLFGVLFTFSLHAQISPRDSSQVYKKRVLESTEIDFLSSYYTQDGENASVTGGIGTEELDDITGAIVISIPLNDDDVLTANVGISSYTSASSSNLNPFDKSGASRNGEHEDEDEYEDDYQNVISGDEVTGSPWVASSGASRQDTWISGGLDYSHSSDDRNTILNANASMASEYDYFSVGFGGGLTKLFNEKNTSVSVSGKVYLDQWKPVYPTELDSYLEVDGDLDEGFFKGVPIWDDSGNENRNWKPVDGYARIENKARNSYSISISFSQILSKNAQFSLTFDAIRQSGLLANPMQRVYFKDAADYFIGNSSSIPIYTSPGNKDVFQLADDIERLPKNRLKLPVGLRFNYYVNEFIVLRTYYRYYFDDWGINSHTASIEVPIKILMGKITFYPSYRFYNQTAADYFKPFNEHISTDEFYTSDYDLSKYRANQFGFGVTYTDVLSQMKLWKIGLKSVDLKFYRYDRNITFSSNLVTLGVKFVLE